MKHLRFWAWNLNSAFSASLNEADEVFREKLENGERNGRIPIFPAGFWRESGEFGAFSQSKGVGICSP